MEAEVIDYIVKNPGQVPYTMLLLLMAFYLVRHWLSSKRYVDDLKRVEQKIEKDPESNIATIGKPNPGRNTIELVEVVHDDLKSLRIEVRASFNDHRKILDHLQTELGRIKGKLDMP